jgi:ParB family chromosome partitioning protein
MECARAKWPGYNLETFIGKKNRSSSHVPSGSANITFRLFSLAARNRSIKAKEGESVGKLLTAFVRKADEGTIGKLIIEVVILLSARTQTDGGKTLRSAAQVYGIDTDAVTPKVKQEFAAKEKAREATKPDPKPTAKPKRAA